MNIKTGIIIGLAATLLFLTSCEKLIEIDQPDIIEQDQAFNDKNSTRLALIGLYGLMADLVEPLFLAGEVRADLVVATNSADTHIKEFSNNKFSASNPYISTKPFYALINNTNDFLSTFGEMLENQEMDSVDFTRYKSELIAIRVWTQYQIAKIFGEVKYYTNVLTPENSTNLETLPFGNELFERLITDLMFSDANVFTSNAESVLWNTVRFSDFYVNVLLGELYLDAGDYANAFEKFREVTSVGDNITTESTRFNIILSLTGENWMKELFSENWESSKLIDNAVFLIAFNNKYNERNDLNYWTKSLNYQVAPATWYYNHFNEYANADLEKIDYRFLSLSISNDNIGQNTYFINKYVENDSPFIMARTARIELLKTYCMNRIYGPRIAIDFINQTRSRVGAPFMRPDLEVFKDSALSSRWITDQIIEELALETGFEGQRWFDIKRVAIERNDPSYLADKVAQKYPISSREEIRTLLMDPNNWYIPVFE